MTTVCTACGATVDADRFCTNCGVPLDYTTQASSSSTDHAAYRDAAQIPAAAYTGADDVTEADSAAERFFGSDVETPSTGSRVWDGVERVGNAVTTVFAVIAGLGWVLFGIIVFVATANGYGDGWLWLIGVGMIVYGIFLIMPTRGTKIIIY